MAKYRTGTGARLPIIFRNLRQAAGYSQAQFAAQIGVTEYMISAVERGDRQPNQEVLNAYGILAERRRR